MFTKIKSTLLSVSQKIGVALRSPTEAQIRVGLFVLGALVLASSMHMDAMAQSLDGGTDVESAFNDARFSMAVVKILTYLEGAFGILIMVISGIGAVVSAAFGGYRAALGLLVVAVGAFILRSLIGTFFNTNGLADYGYEQ